jgi:hypothetical protein
MRSALWRLLSSLGTRASTPARPQAHVPSTPLERSGALSPRDQNRSTVAPHRGAISLCSEKKEERLETPSVVSESLPTLCRPECISATRARRLAAPDRTMRPAFPVMVWPFARAPFSLERCVPTDFCFPLLRLRAPAPRAFPASLRSLRLALFPWLASLERETGGSGVSRRTHPLRRAIRVRVWRFRPYAPEPAEPLTPLSLRPSMRSLS